MSFKEFIADELHRLTVEKNREIEHLKQEILRLKSQLNNLQGSTSYYGDSSLKRAYDALDTFYHRNDLRLNQDDFK